MKSKEEIKKEKENDKIYNVIELQKRGIPHVHLLVITTESSVWKLQ